MTGVLGALLGSGGSSGGGEATVLIDTVFNVSGLLPHSGVNSITWNPGQFINVGSGSNGTSNMCLIAILLFGQANGGTSTSPSVTWDAGASNQAMSQIPGAFVQNGASGGDTYMFYLMNPVLGAKTISFNWTGSNELGVALASFVNVDQTGGTTSFPTVVTSTSSGKTINISTSPTTRKLIGGFNSGTNFTTATDSDIGHDNTMNSFAVAAEYAPATNTLVSYGGGGSGCSLAVAIKGA
jgi:hypothetical protein